jgi:hypothetical protein
MGGKKSIYYLYIRRFGFYYSENFRNYDSFLNFKILCYFGNLIKNHLMDQS